MAGLWRLGVTSHGSLDQITSNSCNRTTFGLIVIFGDKGRCRAWSLGTMRSTRHYYGASPGHKRCTPRVTSASTVSSGPTLEHHPRLMPSSLPHPVIHPAAPCSRVADQALDIRAAVIKGRIGLQPGRQYGFVHQEPTRPQLRVADRPHPLRVELPAFEDHRPGPLEVRVDNRRDRGPQRLMFPPTVFDPCGRCMRDVIRLVIPTGHGMQG